MTSWRNSAFGESIACCPYCHAPYGEGAVVDVPPRGNYDLHHATCMWCKKAMVFACRARGQNILCVGLFTDCSAADWGRLWRAGKVTFDDVLDAHRVIRGR